MNIRSMISDAKSKVMAKKEQFEIQQRDREILRRVEKVRQKKRLNSSSVGQVSIMLKKKGRKNKEKEFIDSFKSDNNIFK